ncbi:MAG: hypothetical protein ABIP89_16810 [Polyangiaceae bacterium]
MERRILLAPLIGLAVTTVAIGGSIGGCGLEQYGLPIADASVRDGFFADDGASGDSTSPADDATTGSDGGPGADGSTDGGTAVDSSAGDSASGGCASGFSCGALGCMATCQGCPGSPLSCASTKTCMSACSGCGSHDVECYLCDSGLPVGRCDTNSASECLGANYQHCSCAILPCLNLTQVCVDDPSHGIHNECRTCGEERTNGGGCGILQHCSESAATCN